MILVTKHQNFKHLPTNLGRISPKAFVNVIFGQYEYMLKAMFTLWCGIMIMKMLRALKTHPKAIPWKFNNRLCVSVGARTN